MKKNTKTWVLALAAIALATWPACSGSGSSDGSPTMYSVGGLVTGLNGETMVLQLNETQDLTVAANGAFVFSGELQAGTVYDVQVLSGPCENIRITNGSGTLDGEVRNIAIHCVRWNSPMDARDTLSPEGSEAYSPRLAMNATGDAIIAWEQEGENSDYHAFFAHLRNGTWTKPQDLSDHISLEGSEAWDIEVALADNGDAVIAYVMDDPVSGYNRIYVSEFRNGTWSHPQSGNDGISLANSHGYEPRVEMYPNGETIVVWRQYLSSRYRLLKSEFRSGTWIHPTVSTTPFDPTNQHAYDHQIAASANGEAIITWRQSDGSRAQVFKSEYRNSTWAHPTDEHDNISPDAQHAYEPRVAIAANGEAAIAWRQYDGSRNQVFLSSFRNATWTHPTGLTDNVSPNGQNAERPVLAMAPNGDTILAWRQYDGDEYRVFKSEFRNAIWTHPADLEDSCTSGGSVDDLRVAMSSTSAVIGYVADYGSHENCFALHFRDNAWQDATRLAPLYTSCEDPTVAIAANGEAMVAWFAYVENTTYQVFLSHFH